MTRNGPADWLADCEKYALIGLEVKIDEDIPFRELSSGLWAWTDNAALGLPEHWREWIGSIRAEEIEGCNLVLLAKMRSSSPQVLDRENQLLTRRVLTFYHGLLLASSFTPSHPPVLFSGACEDGAFGVRESSTLNIPSLNIFRFYPPVLAKEIDRAGALARCLGQLASTQPAGSAWRIFRALTVYCEARTTGDLLDRLHQYCRCIDGLILSEPGNGRNQFKSRTELFIGPRYHELMGRLYSIRSDIEHLHEHKYLEKFDRTVRLDLLEKEAIAEHIARNALAHVVGTPTLWSYFGNTATLVPFWKLDPAERQELWGPPTIRPADALAEYDPQYISNGLLGKQRALSHSEYARQSPLSNIAFARTGARQTIHCDPGRRFETG